MKGYKIVIDRTIAEWNDVANNIFTTLREKTGRYGELKTDPEVFNLSDESTDDILIVGSCDDFETFHTLLLTIEYIIHANFRPSSNDNFYLDTNFTIDDSVLEFGYSVGFRD